MSEAHSKASKARIMKYTPEERKARAILMVNARWSKATPEQKKEHSLKMLKARWNK